MHRRSVGWSRGEDAEDLKKSELDVLVESWTCLNAPGRRILVSKQNVVMDEELVQNIVTDGKFVKNFVMGSKIDPKVVMDLSIFKIVGWADPSQPSNRKLLEEGVEGNDSQLLSIKIPSGDLFLTIQNLERQLMCDDPTTSRSS